jgi:hypothetical protein
MRLTEKSYRQGRIIREHGDVRTPFQRVCDANILATEKQQELQALFEATDPLALREEILRLVLQLFKLPKAKPGHAEDIFTTLAFPETT